MIGALECASCRRDGRRPGLDGVLGSIRGVGIDVVDLLPSAHPRVDLLLLSLFPSKIRSSRVAAGLL